MALYSNNDLLVEGSTLDISLCKDEDTVFDVAKSNEENQLVFGWANVSANADGSIPLDWQDDIIPIKLLENAAYQFVLQFRETGIEHVGETVGMLVESVVFTSEKCLAMGIPAGILPDGWWVGFYIPDKAIFEQVKSGAYRMFSIQGKIRRVKL